MKKHLLQILLTLFIGVTYGQKKEYLDETKFPKCNNCNFSSITDKTLVPLGRFHTPNGDAIYSYDYDYHSWVPFNLPVSSLTDDSIVKKGYPICWIDTLFCDYGTSARIDVRKYKSINGKITTEITKLRTDGLKRDLMK